MSSKKEIYNLIESFEQRITSFIIQIKMAGKPEALELLDELKGLKEVFDTLDDDEVFVYKEISIIDKLKLGQNILALKNTDYTDTEVAEVLTTQTGREILESDITKWLENYSNLSVSNNPEGMRGSVFDTQSQMQSIYERLYSHLEKVGAMDEDKFKHAKTTKVQVELEVYKEIRALTKDAAQIINAVSAINRFKDFQQMVVEAINSVSPQVAQQIMRKLREQKVIMNSLLPPM